MSSKNGGRKRSPYPGNALTGKRHDWMYRNNVKRMTRCTYCGHEQRETPYAYTATCTNPKCRRTFSPNAKAGGR